MVDSNSLDLEQTVQATDESTETSSSLGEMRPKERDYLRDIQKSAIADSTRCIRIARRMAVANKWVNLVTQVFATLAGSAGVGSVVISSASRSSEGSGGERAMLLAVSIVSIVAGVSSAVSRSLALEKSEVRQRTRAIQYDAIARKIAQFVSTPQDDRKSIEIFTNMTVQDMMIADSM